MAAIILAIPDVLLGALDILTTRIGLFMINPYVGGAQALMNLPLVYAPFVAYDPAFGCAGRPGPK